MMLAPLLVLASNAIIPSNELLKTLAPFYGDYVQEKAGWLQKAPIDPDALQRIFNICLNKLGNVNGSPVRFLAVCGNPSGQEFGSHVDVGLIDLYVYSQENRLMFHLPQFAAGSWGVPGKVDTIQIGPLDDAFVVENGYAGMGQSGGWDHIIGIRDDQLVELASIFTVFDNEGAGYCDPQIRNEILADRRQSGIEMNVDCIEATYRYQFDQTSLVSGHADLFIQEEGEINKIPTSRKFRIKFNPSTWTYPIPSTLEYEF